MKPDGKTPTSTHHAKLHEQFIWGIGGLTQGMMNCVFALAYPIFAIGLGVNPALISIANAVPRVVDSLTDPIVGNISDNAHTRWGRRRPFIFVGAILTGLTFPLIFRVNPDWPELAHFFWYMSFAVAFFVAYTVWQIPWFAMGLELTTDKKKRTQIQVIRMLFASASAVAINWAYRLCFVFNDDELLGARSVGILYGAIMMTTGILSAFFVKEWRADVSARKKQSPLGLLPSLKITLSNRPYLLLCGAVVCFVAGLQLVDPMLIYVNIYHVFEGTRAPAATIMGVSATFGVVVSLLMLPIAGWLAGKFGKRRIALTALAMVIIGKGSQFWLVTPANPYLQLISRFLFHPGNMIMWTLVPSMIADVCDLDELQTGRRREAIYGAVYQWLFKFGGTFAMLAAGALLAFIGVQKGGGEEVALPEPIVFRMRLALSLVPPMLGSVAFLCIWRYPLTEQKVEEIKKKLSERSGSEDE